MGKRDWESGNERSLGGYSMDTLHTFVKLLKNK